MNKNRIDDIIDKMVMDSNFCKNSKKKQETEKNEIFECIKNSISIFNQTGEKLALDELMAIVNQNKFEIFDTNGNVIMTELNQVTSTIVTATIETGKRNGLNLMWNSEISKKSEKLEKHPNPNFDNSEKHPSIKDVLVAEGLSKKFELYKDLSDSQKDDFTDHTMQELDRAIEQTEDKETIDFLNKKKSIVKSTKEAVKEKKYMSEEDKEISFKYLEENNKDIVQKFKKDVGEEFDKLPNGKKFDIFLDYIRLIQESLSQEISKEVLEGNDFNNIFQNKKGLIRDIENIEILASEITNLNKDVLQNYRENKRTPMYKGKVDYVVTRSTKENFENLGGKYDKYFNFEIKDNKSLFIEEDSEYVYDKRIFKELMDIPISLAKINIPKEVVKNSLTLYKKFLENLDGNDIELLNPLLGTEQLRNVINEEFEKMGIDDGISEILSTIDYNGQLFNILEDESKRERFLQDLEKSIEGIDLEKQDEPLINDNNSDEFVYYFENNFEELFINSDIKIGKNEIQLNYYPEDDFTIEENENQHDISEDEIENRKTGDLTLSEIEVAEGNEEKVGGILEEGSDTTIVFIDVNGIKKVLENLSEKGLKDASKTITELNIPKEKQINVRTDMDK